MFFKNGYSQPAAPSKSLPSLSADSALYHRFAARWPTVKSVGVTEGGGPGPGVVEHLLLRVAGEP